MGCILKCPVRNTGPKHKNVWLSDVENVLRVIQVNQPGIQRGYPENNPHCMCCSWYHTLYMLSSVSPKSFSEIPQEKTRWPHRLPWKSRDLSGVISSLRVTCDSLLGLARHPTLDTRSTGTLFLFSCPSLFSYFFLFLLLFHFLHTLSICLMQALLQNTATSFSLYPALLPPLPLAVHSNIPPPLPISL